MVRAGIVVIAWCAAVPASGQTLEVKSHAVVYDQVNRLVHFRLDYNREPDFFTLDPQGRQADAFQFHLDTILGNHGFGGTSPLPWETIVRGEEIHVGGDVRIRDHILGPSAKPGSGGWGPIAGSVPYQLVGATQTFTAPFSMLNTTSGKFSYVLELYEFGAWTGVTYDGFSEQIPAPGGALILGIGAVAIARRRRRGPGGAV